VIPVPSLAPTSAEQARHWSENFWPTIYNRSNPFGPHPFNLSKAQDEIGPKAGEWLALAARAGHESKNLGHGEAIGAVVLQAGEPIAVVGDMRWTGCGKETGAPNGNVMSHAAMRAIGMVAKKRIRVDREAPPKPNPADVGVDPKAPEARNTDWFHDEPANPLERYYFEDTDIKPNGYLCVDLDIVLTHEPCIMCSMAILHSRFNRCIFGQRMPLTGGLTADSVADRGVVHGTAGDEGGLQYGLFWRPELNWKFMAWEWQDEEVDENIIPNVSESINA
jgi:tRNA-specific adenosine deaminase 3